MLGFGRVLTAMVTPFKDNGDVDYERAAQLAERLFANGTDSMVVCGTTGESPTLSHDEKLKLLDTVKNVAGNRPCVMGTGSNCTEASVAFSKEAQEHGADAILVVAPYYNKPPQAGLLEHFKAVAASVELPVIVYNIPGRTGIEIKPETLAELAEIPNIVAVKEAIPSLEPLSALEELLRHVDPEPTKKAYGKWVGTKAMEAYSGDDSATLPMMAIGAAGVVSVASHVAGPQMQEMMKAFAEGRLKDALDMHLRLYRLFTGLFATTNPILPKAALALQGFPVGGLRRPLIEATPAQIEALPKVMEDAGVL